MYIFRVLALFVAVSAPLGVARAAQDDRGDKQQVAIRFSLAAGGNPVRCGQDIPGLGTGGRSAQLRDARLYISAAALIDAAGREVPIELDQNDWQYANVALLDFEDKTGKCVGNADIYDTIKGLAPKGRYRGVSFVVGVPSVVRDKEGKDIFLNHSNFATAPAPLDIQAMAWNWQAGRKFIKVEVDPEGGVTRPPITPKLAPGSADGATASAIGAPAMADAAKPAPAKVNADGTVTVSTWMLHLGSTGCRGDAVKGEITSCASANRIPVKFASFDPARQRVVLDLAALFSGIDLGQDKGFSTGCMSGPADPECGPMFENLALRLKETALDANDAGKPSGAVTKIFRVEAAK
ncbi:MbnP family copper-binding protein [Methylocystis iwaonis]|uniref:Metallo-mystery pair system four-Cys motif protein n=1 Tax=Methylocystis iwaonis TaxID=2885079 RepID=A0ABM8EDE3_9HYPH|nr:MbnP family copper-binding protein [Methylocystis iwaonis]BDV36038.1 metallo-mystery pair system four-Cys motif protein [Methylocystis iwaonis]